jgi:spermidine synthase
MDLYALKYMVMRPPVERVIINGLGLGCALRGVLSYPHVRHVDVVEVSQPLVDLMVTLAPWVSDPRVVLHVDDAYTKPWPPGTRWDVAWHDIWDDITTDNDYATLHRRYGRRVTEQGSWGFHLAKGR